MENRTKLQAVRRELGYPAATVLHFGTWKPELASQQILSPVVNGFLAATTTFLLLDWLFRAMVLPRVFPAGRLVEVAGSWAPGVRARLLIFLIAVAFVPLFTMLGLIRAAAMRIESGADTASIVPALTHAGEMTFAVYLAVGMAFTMILARTFTQPLTDIAGALRRLRGGDLATRLQATASDELGVLQDGVNAMAEGLQERERILQTFGRVVEPVVRDRLLAGDLRAEGEERTATVLFCDLRGFTSFAERTPPRELVQTLNEFFAAMTVRARSCGGFVDKFIGDGVLVVFGLFDAAGGPEAGAAAAIRCGLGMRDGLAQLNDERAARGEPPLAMKVGVHTGPVVAGTLGAADRHEYTVIGDTVNVAARLEGLCGEHGCEMIASAATWELARAAGAQLPPASRAAVTARGRGGEVDVYRVA